MASLVGYEISSDEEISDDESECVDSPKRQKLEKSSLPVPDVVKKMFQSGDSQMHKDDPSLHQGRIRTFSHERGNWASFVYIPYKDMETLNDLVSSMKEVLDGKVCIYTVDDFHISLSKTFVVRHHWIDPLVESLTAKTKLSSKCSCDISQLELYCNDECSRTFFGLKVGVGFEQLKKYVKEIDAALTEFKLPVYYKDPSFHMSIAWAKGDIRKQINEETRQQLQSIVDDFIDTDYKFSVIDVQSLLFKTGNKQYNLPLS